MNSLKLIHTIRKHGTSYAIATAFFPKAIRDKVLQLYSFVRKPDNVVDSGCSPTHYMNAKDQLQSDLEILAHDYEYMFDNDVVKSGKFTDFLSLAKSS
jgi:phytoene/squalene synthetase